MQKKRRLSGMRTKASFEQCVGVNTDHNTKETQAAVHAIPTFNAFKRPSVQDVCLHIHWSFLIEELLPRQGSVLANKSSSNECHKTSTDEGKTSD